MGLANLEPMCNLVELLTSGIAVANNKVSVCILEGIRVPDGLEEQGNEAGLKTFRACTVLDQVGEGHVALVVLGINILAVPARGEGNFKAKSIGTVGIQVRLVGHVVAVERGLGLLGVVQAVEAECTLSQIRLVGLAKGLPVGLGRVRLRRVAEGVVAAVCVSGNHAETVREGLDVLVVVGRVTLKVVPSSDCQHVDWEQCLAVNYLREHTTLLGEQLVRAVGVGKVHRGSPVGGHILSNGTRSTVSRSEDVRGSRLAKG
jgi:hypothetical protein